MDYQFPFGEKVKSLMQQDQTPKKVFVLGVYASAVHAKWINNGKTICPALAVASEPYIFWDGDTNEAQRIINQIKIPEEVGSLVLANKNLNGPSSKVLSENILKPFGIDRNDAWLCDLLPESRLNSGQQKVIKEKYTPLIEMYGLNKVTVPVNNGKFCDDIRRKEITKEIIDSRAETLILLGDEPINQYLKYVCDIDFKNLREYTKKYGYGKLKDVQIDGHRIKIMPITHPRNIGKLGAYSQDWYKEHKKWEQDCFKNEQR